MEILNTFGINIFLLAAQAVNFLILLWVMKRFLYKPVISMLEKRRKKIEDSVSNAVEIEKRLQSMDEEREKRRKQALKETQEILADTKSQADEIIQAAHKKAAVQIDSLIKRNEIALKAEKEKLHQEIRNEIADLIVAALSKVTPKIIDNKEQRQIIERSIKDF